MSEAIVLDKPIAPVAEEKAVLPKSAFRAVAKSITRHFGIPLPAKEQIKKFLVKLSRPRVFIAELGKPLSAIFHGDGVNHAVTGVAPRGQRIHAENVSFVIIPNRHVEVTATRSALSWLGFGNCEEIKDRSRAKADRITKMETTGRVSQRVPKGHRGQRHLRPRPDQGPNFGG